MCRSSGVKNHMEESREKSSRQDDTQSYIIRITQCQKVLSPATSTRAPRWQLREYIQQFRWHIYWWRYCVDYTAHRCKPYSTTQCQEKKLQDFEKWCKGPSQTRHGRRCKCHGRIAVQWTNEKSTKSKNSTTPRPSWKPWPKIYQS